MRRTDFSDKEIDIAIDKTHLDKLDAIYPHVQRALPGVTKSRVRRVRKTRPKDKYPHDPNLYYYPIFSPHRHGFQIDLLEQSAGRDKREYPAFFMIWINVNTKYGYAIPLERKDKNTINNAVKQFISSHKVNSIVCDQENAFMSDLVVDTLTEHRISVKYINDQRHSALSAVDRFIRTLRDMNKPTVHSVRQSDHPKYRDFSIRRMNKLLKIYNTTVHTVTGLTPEQMENDEGLEEKYIIKKLYETERRKRIADFDLKPGTYVRYILPRDVKKKNRFEVSPEAYIISHKDGNAYAIQAADGTVRTVARWRLFPIGTQLPPKMKFANSFHTATGAVQEITDYDAKTRRYTVNFSMPDGSVFKDVIHERNLRGSTPQVMSDVERAYWERVRRNG